MMNATIRCHCVTCVAGKRKGKAGICRVCLPCASTGGVPDVKRQAGEMQSGLTRSAGRVAMPVMSERTDDERPKRAAKGNAAKSPEGGLWLAGLLRKFVELSILAAIIGSVLAISVTAPPAMRSRLATWVAELNGGTMPSVTEATLASFGADLLEIFAGNLPPWEHRVGLFAMLVLIGVGAHLSAKVYERACGRVVFEDPSRAPRRGRHVWRRRLFIISLVALVVHAFSSYFFGGWVALLPSVDSYGSEISYLATSQMPRTLEAALMLGLVVAWFFAAEDALRSRRFVFSLVGLLITMGVVVAALSIVLQRPSGPELSPGVLPTAPLGAPSTWLPPMLLPPLLLAWTVLCLGGGGLIRWDRALLSAAIALMMLALLEWADFPSLLLAVGGFVVLMWLLQRRAGVEFSMATVVGVPLVVGALIGVLMLTGDTPRAFLLHGVVESDGDVMVPPVRLGLNDRLRVLFVSLPIILENPVLGTGWGSFPYVYPEARARFFTLHPDTILSPAPFGLMHARNDLLQLVFEVGILGALLAVGGVVMMLSSGWASLRGCVRQGDVTLQLGIFISVLVLLGFGLIESAFRIPSVAAMLVVLMAIWANGERLWRLEVPRLEERVVGLADLPATEARAPDGDAASTRGRLPGMGLWWVTTLGVAFGICYFGAVAGQWFSGRMLLAEGTRMMARAVEPGLDAGARRDRLIAANGALDIARRLQPQAGDILFASARLQLAFAREKLADADRVDQVEYLLAPPDVLRRLALNDASQGLMLLEEAELTMRGKELFRVRAMLHDAAARSGHGDPTESRRKALQALGQAVRLNPGDAGPVVMLVRWTRGSDVPTEQNMMDLYGFLYRFHPTEFESSVVGYIDRLMAWSDDAEAYREARRVYSINPQDERLRFKRAWTAFFAGDLGLANSEATAMRGDGVAGAVLLDALIAARDGAYGRAKADAQVVQAMPQDGWEAGWLELFLSVLSTRIPPTSSAREEALEELLSELSDRPAAKVTVARMLSSVFQDHNTAYDIMVRVTQEPEGSQDAQAWAVLSDVMVRRVSNAMTLLRQLDRQPIGPALPWERLRPVTARPGIAEAVLHLDRAMELAPNDEVRTIIKLRQRRLELLLPPGERTTGQNRNDADE